MKNPTCIPPARLATILAGLGLAALAAAQVQAAPAAMQSGEVSESGTIPAARPGLPQMRRGAEGPLRTDEHPGKADPSIRDSNPLTINGLWETLPGNGIAHPRR